AAVDDAVRAVGGRVGEPERTKHVRRDIGKKVFSRGVLDDGRDEVPTVARVGEAGARWEQERVVLEDRESVAHRGEVPVQQELVVLVMPDAGEVSRELARGDGISLVGEGRYIALDRRVEMELPPFVQQGDGRSRERLGDAADAELR